MEKLKRAIVDKIPIIDKETTCTPSNGFPPNVRYELIDSSSLDTVYNPINEVVNTYSSNDRNCLALGRKYKYKECWYRELFDAKCQQSSMDDEG